jgi:hypothetical protein
VKRSLLILVVIAAGLLTACLPPPPPPPPPPPTKGFDACAAPSQSTMSTWKQSSPYSNVGIYIGGSARGCAQPNLTSNWVVNVRGQGWGLLPIWVGGQAPCTTLTRVTKISPDFLQAWYQGINEANAAADAAGALGIGPGAPIYYDMEAYPRGGACTTAVLQFTDGWVGQLHARGYQAGMYSSLCSGIMDQAQAVGTGRLPLDAIWIAAWNDKPSIYGFGAPCALNDLYWNQRQRVHQYTGGHDESYGGVLINIDSNLVDAPTA